MSAPDATANSPAPAGSATEDPRIFWAPWIVLSVVCVGLLVIAREGTSAVAVALIAHLFRGMAQDDMPDKSPNAPTSATGQENKS